MLQSKLKVFLIIFALVFLCGCGVFDKYNKNKHGYYERAYYSCGPLALEKVLKVHRNQISKDIQDYNSLSKKFLSIFEKEAVLITWPSEIKKVCEKYGYKVITVKELSELDPKKDQAVVLVHRKFDLNSYHWIIFPLESMDYYGDKTVVDKIFLLKRIDK